jgi:hypothetical protein
MIKKNTGSDGFCILSKIEVQGKAKSCSCQTLLFIGLAYQGKDIVFRFIIEYT